MLERSKQAGNCEITPMRCEWQICESLSVVLAQQSLPKNKHQRNVFYSSHILLFPIHIRFRQPANQAIVPCQAPSVFSSENFFLGMLSGSILRPSSLFDEFLFPLLLSVPLVIRATCAACSTYFPVNVERTLLLSRLGSHELCGQEIEFVANACKAARRKP